MLRIFSAGESLFGVNAEGPYFKDYKNDGYYSVTASCSGASVTEPTESCTFFTAQNLGACPVSSSYLDYSYSRYTDYSTYSEYTPSTCSSNCQAVEDTCCGINQGYNIPTRKCYNFFTSNTVPCSEFVYPR